MQLICLTGIDGAGKTTLARALADELRSRGMLARYVYGRTYPVASRLLMSIGRRVFLRKHDFWSEYESYNIQKKSSMRNPVLRTVYASAIVLDYLVQVWVKLLWQARGGGVVILDRYLYDTVISDLAVHLEYTTKQVDHMLDWGFRLLPIPRVTLLIDISEEVAMSRKNDVPHLQYLEERRRYYRELQTRGEIRVIDGEQGPEALLDSAAKMAVGALIGLA